MVLGNLFLCTEADLKGLDEATLGRYAKLLGFFPFPQIRPLHPATGKQDRLSLIQHYAPFTLLPRGTQANIDVLTDASGTPPLSSTAQIAPESGSHRLRWTKIGFTPRSSAARAGLIWTNAAALARRPTERAAA